MDARELTKKMFEQQYIINEHEKRIEYLEQENYENQIRNLQDKIKHLDEHINYMKELERRC